VNCKLWLYFRSSEPLALCCAPSPFLTVQFSTVEAAGPLVSSVWRAVTLRRGQLLFTFNMALLAAQNTMLRLSFLPSLLCHFKESHSLLLSHQLWIETLTRSQATLGGANGLKLNQMQRRKSEPKAEGLKEPTMFYQHGTR
jgi:hypothetical protein